MSFRNEILGGILIGVGSAIPLLFEGRIAGVSGYAESSLRPATPAGRTALFFVAGLVLAGFCWRAFGGDLPDPGRARFGWAAFSVAGFLVGFGSRLGGGCTSGHGVCGIGRLSPRSFVAVSVFMAVAMLTALSMRFWS